MFGRPKAESRDLGIPSEERVFLAQKSPDGMYLDQLKESAFDIDRMNEEEPLFKYKPDARTATILLSKRRADVPGEAWKVTPSGVENEEGNEIDANIVYEKTNMTIQDLLRMRDLLEVRAVEKGEQEAPEKKDKTEGVLI